MVAGDLCTRLSNPRSLDVIVNSVKNRICFKEVVEEHYVKGRKYEKWRVRLAEDLETGAKYWCYMGRVE